MRLRAMHGCAVALWLSATVTHAQPTEDEARGHFLQGRAAFESGRYEDALTHFERSYELSGRAQLLYNIGLAQERLHRDPEALASLDRYLETAAPDDREAVEQRIASIRARINAAEQRSGVLSAEPAERPRKPLVRQWWFWTSIGVAAAGIVTGIVVATSGNSSSAIPGDIGGVIATLK